ncbi:MAG: sirohydrochlorin chelatase [Pirellulales bacterium]
MSDSFSAVSAANLAELTPQSSARQSSAPLPFDQPAVDLGLPPDRLGVLLIGHGTRSVVGQQEFLDTVAQVAQRFAGSLVRPCFLELVEPSIDAAIDQLVETGVTHVAVAPLLLFAAGHAKRDVPAAIESARNRHPHVRFSVGHHLGCHPRLLELSASRFRDAQGVRSQSESHASDAAADKAGAAPPTIATSLADAEQGHKSSTQAWVLVGRGSLDPTAWAETQRFLELRRTLTPVQEARVAYLAMAQPRLTETLAELGPLPYDTIVVQPHLLFAGDLLTQVHREVVDAAVSFPRIEWRLAAHCGVSSNVADAVADRIREAQREWGVSDCVQTSNRGGSMQ